MERLDHLIEVQEQLRKNDEEKNQEAVEAFKALNPIIAQPIFKNNEPKVQTNKVSQILKYDL